MFRNRLFWILFALVAAACAVVGFAYFPAAFPLVTLDLQMDRALALETSGDLAEAHGWGPSGFRQAAAFRLDAPVQNFVELEAGETTPSGRCSREASTLLTPGRFGTSKKA